MNCNCRIVGDSDERGSYAVMELCAEHEAGPALRRALVGVLQALRPRSAVELHLHHGILMAAASALGDAGMSMVEVARLTGQGAVDQMLAAIHG